MDASHLVTHVKGVQRRCRVKIEISTGKPEIPK